MDKNQPECSVGGVVMALGLDGVDIEQIRSSIIKIDMGVFDDDKLLEKTYLKANKSIVDWISLFLCSFETLSGIRNDSLATSLSKAQPMYQRLSSLYEGYNRKSYGSHYHYNRMVEFYGEHHAEIQELVEFVFKKILYTSSSPMSLQLA